MMPCLTQLSQSSREYANGLNILLEKCLSALKTKEEEIDKCHGVAHNLKK
jgi:hypothetical protein